MKLGEKLLYLRKTKGLSQEQLASEVTVSRQAISKWELGESMPDTENVVQLTKIFDVSADFLLNDEVDIPIGAGGNEGTESDVMYSMLKNELKDNSDKLALKMYESRMKKGGKHNWQPAIFSLLGLLGIVSILCIYYFFFR
jgi:transcriptional regulator with XRE-family HTH domain